MSKSKKNKPSSRSHIATVKPSATFIARTAKQYIAQAIKEDPSLWIELPLPPNVTKSCVTEGVDIQFPIQGQEYMIVITLDKAGNIFLTHFFAYLASLAHVRAFYCEGEPCVRVCTDASDDIMRSAISLTHQALEQKLGPKFHEEFVAFRSSEFGW